VNETLDLRVIERTNALQEREVELRNTNRRKDEFLATLAHELRNPLAPIRNAAEILRRKSVGAQEQWASALIERQVSLLARLINDLMDVSRINEGKIELRCDVLEVGALVEEAIESTRPLATELEHTISYTGTTGVTHVRGDATRLVQALTNLLNNAAKYTERGGEIFVTIVETDPDCVIQVRDTGIGLAPDKLEEVFEMFAQVESAVSQSRGGLGIGLSLTKRLIELHGGNVVARSDGIGRGAEFLVRLPLLATSRKTSAGPSVPGQERGSASIKSNRVLVADDNVDAAATLGALLEDMGQTVRIVHDGAAAVAAVEEFQPDVAILDIGMPILDGLDACKRIRQMPRGAAMKLVACTGRGQQLDLAASSAVGFDHHWVKPLDSKKLIDLLTGLGGVDVA
ncbi:MAG: putative histidine kinase, atypical hybrid, partial [Rhodoferax sp.]|nr:putative histidine kinase, atypical hybrid [Rhodoferax sp.]